MADLRVVLEPDRSSDDAIPLLSDRLATLELGAVERGELTEAVAAEALRLLEGRRAALWTHHPAVSRLFLEQRGRDMRAIDVGQGELAAMVSRPDLWEPEPGGTAYRLLEASFGVTGPDAPPVLAIPITRPGTTIGVLLVERHAPGQVAPAALAAFGRQVAATLVNHEALDRTRRHEAQLEALYITAGELSSKLELQRVLEAITDRARQLADAPIAYVMLVDAPRGEIYMRAVTGVTSRRFQQIRLKIGTGLGGTTAQESRPLYTSDYLCDARFSHSPDVDVAVREERIKSILGVPIRSADECIGVLYVADRTVRVFGEADVDVLSSLAHHAGVAIDNAALYEQATTALAEADEMNRLAQEQNLRLRQADEAHRLLSEAMLSGHGLTEISSLLASLVGTWVAVLDHRRRPLATAGTPADTLERRLAQRERGAARLERDEEAALARAETVGATGVLPACPSARRAAACLIVPTVAGGEILGSVWVQLPPEQVEEKRPLVEQASRVVALELLRQRSVAEAERQLRSELLNHLLAGSTVRGAALIRHAADLGVDLEVPHRIAVSVIHPRRASFPPETLRRAREDFLASLRRSAWCQFVAEHAGRVVSLVAASVEDPSRHFTRVSRDPKDGVQIQTAISSPCMAAGEYRANFVACDRALELFSSEPRAPVLDLDEMGVLSVLFRPGGESDLATFVERRLGGVVEHDRQHRSDLVRTLDAYLKERGSATRAAAALHVHVNTVYYRLERLRELLGPDFAEPGRALDLQIALLARRVTVSL